MLQLGIMRKPFYILGILLLVSFAGNVFLAWQAYDLSGNVLRGAADIRAVQDELQGANDRIATLEKELAERNEEIAMLKDDRDLLEENLEEERDRNEDFEDQIKDLAGTVGVLDKLAQTDEELLQKYSRVYFLNENYQPEDLDAIDREYLYDENNLEYAHADVEPHLSDMLDDAADDDIDLWIVSGYRSFDEQEALKGDYLVRYGSGSNAFSADQGYSEHQLGTTFDFTTTGLSGGLDGFEATAAYEWLLDNAHEYGFVLSYPDGNSYYVFEPWHWRFVGVELAEDLHDDDENFYDLDQREINEYLVDLFE